MENMKLEIVTEDGDTGIITLFEGGGVVVEIAGKVIIDRYFNYITIKELEEIAEIINQYSNNKKEKKDRVDIYLEEVGRLQALVDKYIEVRKQRDIYKREFGASPKSITLEYNKIREELCELAPGDYELTKNVLQIQKHEFGKVPAIFTKESYKRQKAYKKFHGMA